MKDVQHQQLVEYGRRIQQAGLVQGTGGNLSAMDHDMRATFLVTPSGMDYDRLRADDICQLDRELELVTGHRKPSVESRLHRDIYVARPDVCAIIHTHSLYASAMATARVRLPVIEAGLASIGDGVHVAEYADTASEQLSQNAILALGENQAVLLANHGLVAVADSLEEAFRYCELIEFAAHKYILASGLGRVHEIPAASRPHIVAFKASHYGQT